jgi:hypothetical protein
MSFILDPTDPKKAIESAIANKPQTTQKTIEVINGQLPASEEVETLEDMPDWFTGVVEPPKGFSRIEFNRYLDAYVSYFKQNGVAPLPIAGQLLRRNAGTLEIGRARQLIVTDEFKQALSNRGVSSDWRNDPRKLMAMGLLSDPLTPGTFTSKLNKLGLTPAIWDTFLADRDFAQAFNKMVEENFTRRQAEVNLAVQEMATKPGSRQLDAAKYFNELSGRFDPARRQVMDIRLFTQGVIDIITAEVTDGATLQRIADKLGLLVSGSGAS